MVVVVVVEDDDGIVMKILKMHVLQNDTWV